jgi:hypothetical protein
MEKNVIHEEPDEKENSVRADALEESFEDGSSSPSKSVDGYAEEGEDNSLENNI